MGTILFYFPHFLWFSDSSFVHRKCDAIIKRRPFFRKNLGMRERERMKTKTDRRNLPSSLCAFNKVLRIYQRIEPFPFDTLTLLRLNCSLTLPHIRSPGTYNLIALPCSVHMCAFKHISSSLFTSFNISKRQKRQHLTLHIFLII